MNDDLCTQIMSTLPLEYFKNFAYHRQFITGDFYSTTLKTECQGSWADGFAVLGKSKSDFDLAFPINKNLRISENCCLNIINLHKVPQNLCYVTLEILACTTDCDNKSSWLNDLIYFKNEKNFLSIEQLRKRIVSKIDELSLTNGFSTLCVSTRESQDKLNPCFTINLMLSISKTLKPLQHFIQQLETICKNIHENKSAINCVPLAIFNAYEIIRQCGWNEIINFDIETFFQSNWQTVFENDFVHIFKELFLFRDPICFEHVTQTRNEAIRFSFKILLLFFKSLNSEYMFNDFYVNDIVTFCRQMKMNSATYISSWSSSLKQLNRNNYQPSGDNFTEDLLMLSCWQFFTIFTSTVNNMIENCEDKFRDIILNIEINHCVEEDIFRSFQHAVDYFAAKTSLTFCIQLKDIINDYNICDKANGLLTVVKMLKDFLIILFNFMLSFSESQDSMECFQNNPKLSSKVSEFYTEIIRKVRGARLEDVELVPCFKFSGWPEVAQSWNFRKRYWPDITVIETILKDGFHVVLKTSPGGDKELETRLSFSHAEIQLFKSFTLMQDVSFYVFKLLFYLELSSPKVLSTYYIKTIAFWVFEESSPEFWEKDDSAAKCILLMIERLYDALSTGILHHYFIPEQNLFVSIPREQLVMISKKVKDILLNPVHYIEKVAYYINAFIDPYSKDLWKPCAKVRDIYFYSESLKSYISTYIKIL